MSQFQAERFIVEISNSVFGHIKPWKAFEPSKSHNVYIFPASKH